MKETMKETNRSFRHSYQRRVETQRLYRNLYSIGLRISQVLSNSIGEVQISVMVDRDTQHNIFLATLI